MPHNKNTLAKSRRNSVAAHPQLVVIAGPNGAGKSTLAPTLLRDRFGVMEFVNADPIAKGLSEFRPETVAFEAGRAMQSVFVHWWNNVLILRSKQLCYKILCSLDSKSQVEWLSGPFDLSLAYDSGPCRRTSSRKSTLRRT